MESLRAIEFRGGLPNPQRAELQPAQIQHLAAARSAPVACLVAASDLDAMARLLPAGLLADRGAKHRAKPLAEYFKNRSGLIAIRAGYTDAGQAERGVRALLAGVGARARGSVFLIGVSAPLFEELWLRAGASASLLARGCSGAAAPFNQRFLLDQTAQEIVPAELREKYRGSSAEAEIVRRMIVRAARDGHPVLIQGETGTGKEVVARQIHNRGPRATERFMAINCGGIPGELLESELFGHVRGAFTGAIRNKQGLWTLADRGTLFLDEIGDLSPQHQVKVLRALEKGRYIPVGAVMEVRSAARIIAATNRDLAQMVEAGQFREDLYYRLFNFRIRTPALRDHPDDIPELADHFWRDIAGDEKAILPAAVTDALKTYRWPGNARELRAFLINVFLLVDHRGVNVPLIHSVMQERLGPMARANADQ